MPSRGAPADRDSVFLGVRMMACVAAPKIRDQQERRFADGTFRTPRRAGIAFMLSPHIVNAHAKPVGAKMKGTAARHDMTCAPYVTNEMLKPPPKAYREMPWLPQVGHDGPAGVLIVPIPEEERRPSK